MSSTREIFTVVKKKMLGENELGEATFLSFLLFFLGGYLQLELDGNAKGMNENQIEHETKRTETNEWRNE